MKKILIMLIIAIVLTTIPYLLFDNWRLKKDYNFQLFTPASCFTDDTVCNVALLKAFQLNGSKTTKKDVLTCLYHTCKMYDYVGYAKMFRAWLNDDSLLFKPYGSWGMNLNISPNVK